MILNPDKITSLSIYTRGFDFCRKHNLLCHVYDNLYGGKSEFIHKISNSEVNDFKLEVVCSEDRKFRSYFKDRLNVINNHGLPYIFQNKYNYANYMKEIFHIYPINKKNCYYNYKGITHFNDRVKSDIDYFMNGCDC